MSIVLYGLYELAAPVKIPSVNNMYKPKSSYGKSFAWLYKDPKVELYQASIIKQARKSELALVSTYADRIKHVDISFVFLLDKNILKRDVSNMIKMTEDALMEVTKIDDSCHRRVTAIKDLSLMPKKEYVICKYEIFLNESKQ